MSATEPGAPHADPPGEQTAALGRMRRRTLVLSGAALAGGAAAAHYAPLALGDGFEEWLAARLGVTQDAAENLLRRVRDHYGELEYESRASLFVLAARAPLADLLPREMRRRLITAFIAPMYDTTPRSLDFVRDERASRAADCGGLVSS